MIDEVAAGRLSPLAGVDPFPVMSGRTRQLPRGLSEQLGLGLRQQAVAKQNALVANDQRAVALENVAGPDFLRQRRHHAAVVPADNDLGPVALGRKAEGDDRRRGRGLILDLRRRVPVGRTCLHALGPTQLECLERGRQVVAANVAQHTGAEVPPATPGERMVGGVIGSLGGRAKPQVPVEPRGHGRRCLRPRHAARRDVGPAVRPGVDLPDFADRAGPDVLADHPRAFACLALVSHLGSHVGLLGRPGHFEGLPYTVRQRLLAEYVLAHLDRHHRNRGVSVVRGGDHYRVDLLLRLEHLAEIGVEFGLGKLLGVAVQRPAVDVAQGHHVLAADPADISRAHSADPHARNVQLLAGRGLARSSQDVSGHDRQRRGRGAGPDHLAAVYLAGRFHGAVS